MAGQLGDGSVVGVGVIVAMLPDWVTVIGALTVSLLEEGVRTCDCSKLELGHEMALLGWARLMLGCQTCTQSCAQCHSQTYDGNYK